MIWYFSPSLIWYFSPSLISFPISKPFDFLLPPTKGGDSIIYRHGFHYGQTFVRDHWTQVVLINIFCCVHAIQVGIWIHRFVSQYIRSSILWINFFLWRRLSRFVINSYAHVCSTRPGARQDSCGQLDRGNDAKIMCNLRISGTDGIMDRPTRQG